MHAIHRRDCQRQIHINLTLMKKNTRVIYCCQECGHQTPKWMGRCPECGGWDTLVEEKPAPQSRGGQAAVHAEPVPIDAVPLEEEPRMLTGIREFDRVLGGGVIDAAWC